MSPRGSRGQEGALRAGGEPIAGCDETLPERAQIPPSIGRRREGGCPEGAPNRNFPSNEFLKMIHVIRKALSSRLLCQARRLLFGRPAFFRFLMPLHPVSKNSGADRGQPIDRYYIQQFLGRHRDCIRGRVLEVGSTQYSKRFGEKAQSLHVLHLNGEDCPEATLVADLGAVEELPEARFDCFVCPQMFQYLPDISGGVRGAFRLLKPGGTMLATFPALSRRSAAPDEAWADQWRFTSTAVRREFSEVFGEDNVQVESAGNALAAAGFLMGLSAEDIGSRRLDWSDAEQEVLITLTATKRAQSQPGSSTPTQAPRRMRQTKRPDEN